jgi:hypothetical protein
MKYLKLFELYNLYNIKEGQYVILGDNTSKDSVFWFHLYGIIVQNYTDYIYDDRKVFLIKLLSDLNEKELKELANNNEHEPDLEPLTLFVHECNIIFVTDDFTKFVEQVENIEFNENENYNFKTKKFIKKVKKVKEEIKSDIENFQIKKDAKKYNI